MKKATLFSPTNEDETQVKSQALITQRFFKVMTPDFHTTMRLPRVFCKKLKGGMPENAVLISRKGTWNVKIGGCMNEQVCFEEGWDKFAESHKLGVGDFVVFEHQGNMHFKVLVYDSTCCENDFHSDVAVDEDEDDFDSQHVNRKNKRGQQRMICFSSQQKRQFTAKVTGGSLHQYIPKSFWKPNELQHKTKIMLSGPSGDLCEMKLIWYARTDTVFISRGWIEFCKSNGLKDGDVCIFKLSSEPSTSGCPVNMSVQVIEVPN